MEEPAPARVAPLSCRDFDGLRTAPVAAAIERLDALCARLEALEPELRAWLPEPGRRERLVAELRALDVAHPDREARPALYGVPVAVKDIISIEGLPRTCGSALPAALFEAPEAECVRRLRAAGALIVGRSVTTQFAYADPGPTTNPWNPRHTPGGSSSGSAAAVASGTAALALGTQTVGSVIRPAAFCGVVGFKPTLGRVPCDGVLPFSKSVDTVGWFAQDVAGIERLAPLLCDGWSASPEPRAAQPRVVVPDGPLLELARPAALADFEHHLEALAAGGIAVVRAPCFDDLRDLIARHHDWIAREFALAHEAWFRTHGSLYGPLAAMLVDRGRSTPSGVIARGRESARELAARLAALLDERDALAFVCPAAVGPAPSGLASTGDASLNLPWTHAGVPALTLPAGFSRGGLPLGLQLAARRGDDAALLALAARAESALAHSAESALAHI